MFKSLLFIPLCLLLSLFCNAQEVIKKDSIQELTPGQKLDKFFFKEHSPKVYKPPSSKKNTIYLQALGDTPWAGIGYSRRMYQHSSFLLEMGGGFGLAPHLFERRDPKPKNFSFSHHARIVFRPSKLISPTVTYAGVWMSDEFFKDKLFNYRPSPMLGVRLGNSNSVAINLNWVGYFYNQNFVELVNNENVINGYRKKLLGLPSASIQLSF